MEFGFPDDHLLSRQEVSYPKNPEEDAPSIKSSEEQMSEFIVLSYKTETGVAETTEILKDLQKQLLIQLIDAAIVVRKPDGKVRVKQAMNLVGSGALGNAFWGLLIGTLFWMPWLGMALGAVTGAISGKLSDFGISDDFIREVGGMIEPGNSALFLMIADWTEDKVLESLKNTGAQVVRTSLPNEAEDRLREAFGASEEVTA